MQLKRLDRDALGVEGANDLGQLGVAAGEPHRGALRGGRGRLAEAPQHFLHAREIAGLGGNHLHARAADLGLQRLGGALGNDTAVVDDAHPIGEHVGLLEILRRQEDRDATIGSQALHLLPQRGAALWVEAGGRLVEKEDPGAMDERQRQIEAALHAARVTAHPAVGGLGESHAREQGRGALAPLAAAHAVQRGLQLHVLGAGQKRVERRLLERGADRRSHRRALLHDVVAGHARRARGGRQQRGEHVDGGGLTGAVGAQEAVHLAGLDAQLDSVDGARPLLELADEVGGFDCGFTHDGHATRKCLRLLNIGALDYDEHRS